LAKGLTSTKHFGFSPLAMHRLLELLGTEAIHGIGQDADVAENLGVGTVQLEALGAWARFAGLIECNENRIGLSAVGRLVYGFDPKLTDICTWWAIHCQLAFNYAVWTVLPGMPPGKYSLEEIDAELHKLAEDVSQRTVHNARRALVSALAQTPLGQHLGLVHLESDGRRIIEITKLPIRYGDVPLAAVGYALTDWARRAQTSGAALASLAAPDGPGPVLHMSEGVLERYLMDIDGAYKGRVLRYSRTAGLDQAYFQAGVKPLHVLASHYINAQEGLDWPEALQRAQEEVTALDGS